jgi:hypothetical protein
MKIKSEKLLVKALNKESLNLYEIFEIIHDDKLIITKEISTQIKTKVIQNSLGYIEDFDGEARISALKSVVKNLKTNFKYIEIDFGPEIHMLECEKIKINILAVLKKELKLLTKSEKDIQTPKIQITCETSVLYALFEELNKEIFLGINLEHRISQLIAKNFIGKDNNIIDQKTSYNKIKAGSSEKAKTNLNVILEKICRRIK